MRVPGHEEGLFDFCSQVCGVIALELPDRNLPAFVKQSVPDRVSRT